MQNVNNLFLIFMGASILAMLVVTFSQSKSNALRRAHSSAFATIMAVFSLILAASHYSRNVYDFLTIEFSLLTAVFATATFLFILEKRKHLASRITFYIFAILSIITSFAV